ncbi:hypothetical protein GVAV_000085 [Gurleya vavrai]
MTEIRKPEEEFVPNDDTKGIIIADQNALKNSRIFYRQPKKIQTKLSRDYNLTSKIDVRMSYNKSSHHNNKTQGLTSYAQNLKIPLNDNQNEAVDVSKDLMSNFDDVIHIADTDNHKFTIKDENLSVEINFDDDLEIYLRCEKTEETTGLMATEEENKFIKNFYDVIHIEDTENYRINIRDENSSVEKNFDDDLEINIKCEKTEETTGLMATEEEKKIIKNIDEIDYETEDCDLQIYKKIDDSIGNKNLDSCKIMYLEQSEDEVQCFLEPEQQFANCNLHQNETCTEQLDSNSQNVANNSPNTENVSQNNKYDVEKEWHHREYITAKELADSNNLKCENLKLIIEQDEDQKFQVLSYDYIPMRFDERQVFHSSYKVDPLNLNHKNFESSDYIHNSQILNGNLIRIKAIESYDCVEKNINKFSKSITDLLSEGKSKKGEIASSKPVNFSKEGLLNFYSKNSATEISDIFLTNSEVNHVNEIIKYTIMSYYDNCLKIYDLKNIEILKKLQLNNEAEDVFLILEYKNSKKYDYKLHFEAIDQNKLRNSNLHSENVENLNFDPIDDYLYKEGLYIINNGFYRNKELKTLIYCDLNYKKSKIERYLLTDADTPENAKKDYDNCFTLLWNRYYICNNMIKIYEIFDSDLICSEIKDAEVNSGFVLISFNSTDFNIKFKYSVIKMDKILVQIDENLQSYDDSDSVLHITFRT